MSVFQIELISITFFVGLICLYFAFQKNNKKRQAEDTIRSQTESAPQGFVEMQGFAWPVGTNLIRLPSSFEGVYYVFSLQKQITKGSGKNRKTEWITVFSYSFGESFYLLDAKGLALININASELNLDSSQITNWNYVPSQKKSFLLSNVITELVPSFPPSDFLFGLFSYPFRIVENEIPLGSPVYVRGTFSSRGLENTYAESTGMTRFHQQVYKENSTQLKNLSALLDADKNNKISSNEALQGYAKIAQISKRISAQENFKEKQIEVFGEFIKSTEHPLFIANAHEQQLIERLEKNLLPLYAGAVICLTISAFTLFMSPDKFYKITQSIAHSKNFKK